VIVFAPPPRSGISRTSSPSAGIVTAIANRLAGASRLHQPPVERGADGFGLPAMRCQIFHQPANFEPAGVPGDPAWHLAPHDMA
jgi:hypothetical protein